MNSITHIVLDILWFVRYLSPKKKKKKEEIFKDISSYKTIYIFFIAKISMLQNKATKQDKHYVKESFGQPLVQGSTIREKVSSPKEKTSLNC